jgi:hypothetical protein
MHLLVFTTILKKSEAVPVVRNGEESQENSNIHLNLLSSLKLGVWVSEPHNNWHK